MTGRHNREQGAEEEAGGRVVVIIETRGGREWTQSAAGDMA